MAYSSALASYERFLDLVLEYVPPNLIVDFKVTEAEDEHIHDLLDKNNEGLLTPDEKAELDHIAEFERVISWLKAKAIVAAMKRG